MSKNLGQVVIEDTIPEGQELDEDTGITGYYLLSGKVLLAHVNPLTRAMSFQLQTPIISQLMLGI